MKKEIDVYVATGAIKDYETGKINWFKVVKNDCAGIPSIKAKLTIDIPRKKMLTEDQVYWAMKRLLEDHGEIGIEIEKLFGGEE